MTRPGISGSVLDRRHGFKLAAEAEEQVDVIIGDWMSEGNMVSAAFRKLSHTNNGQGDPGYERSFLPSIASSLPTIARKGIKVVVNAGASDPEGLSKAVSEASKKQGLHLKTAWVTGDEVMDQVRDGLERGEPVLYSVETREPLKTLPEDIVYAQAYLGAAGIAEGLRQGADIVICGRVADASLVVGAVHWWHGWTREQHQELASSLVAGHLIECSTYVTGGNFSGFKSVPGLGNLGFPIAEIGHDGDVIITKLAKTGGYVTTDTVTAQLLYEIQGPLYFNSDVTARLDDIQLTQLEPDRVRVQGVCALPPPPTTKVGLTGKRRYKAEVHWSLVGLDIAEKAELLKTDILASIGQDAISRFNLLRFDTYGVCPENPASQNAATVDFRIFAQADSIEALSPQFFLQPILNVIMCSYPGATMQPSFAATGLPQPYSEYYVVLIPQEKLKHAVHIGGQSHSIPPPTFTQIYPPEQRSHDPLNPIDITSFGEMTQGPIGWIVHARSGDKGSNANVGFWARDDEEYAWLRSLLTIPRIQDLLGAEYKPGNRIERVEFPGLRAVHFVLYGHLDRGVNSTSTYDILGKNVAEFLRARHVPLPKKFLVKGKI
ncbi:hypothetical protein NFIA_057110 [Paecilomyces variotii No. 5]|uniref:DUF1446 domain protein n=1 Tax=Byssochlamys spectabilis (strain No. 5 / NBRC 109023) TaxID=1356009 RepID=V5G3J3_BYSSN|nr:hypothetical protein NFIA_057110 [Paecilomyces variotii No. 5]